VCRIGRQGAKHAKLDGSEIVLARRPEDESAGGLLAW
jgi:hypothetical protein